MSGEERGAGGVEAFGRWLLRERELRGLGRDEVARRTRLAVAVVEALESGDASRMPPRAYLLGTLRTYAAAVGLDADDVVLRWQEVEPAAQGGAARRARRRRLPLLWLAAAAAAALLAAALALRSGAPPERARRTGAAQAPRGAP